MNRTDKSKRLDMARLHFKEFYENFYNALLENGKFQKGSELGMHALCNSLVWAWNIHIAYGVTEGKDNVRKMPISLNPQTKEWLTDFIKVAIEAKEQLFRGDRFAVEDAKVHLLNDKPIIEIEFGKEEPL
jgi:hypothetical protein